MANSGSADSPVQRELHERSAISDGSPHDDDHVTDQRSQGSRLWPLPLLLAGGIVHTIARSGSYLGLYGSFLQDGLVMVGLLLIFTPALYVLWRSRGRPAVRRLMLWGVACGLIHFALNIGDSIPSLMGYWLFNDSNAVHIVAQEMFSSAAFALLAAGLYYSMVSYQMSEVTVALERDHLKAEVNERKRTEDVLRERQETFRALAENSFDTIMRFDGECRHLYVNPIVEAQTGIPPSAFIGKTHAEMGFPEGLAALWEDAIRKVFETRQPNRIECQLPTGIWMDWLLVPEFDKTGEARAVLGSARDITERKRAEEQQRDLEAQLAQAQKMESVGRLAGGIAHDFNNLLTIILGYGEMALMSSEGLTPVVQASVQQILKAGERTRDLTRQLLAFARKQTLEMKVLDLNEVVIGFEKMLARLIGEDIQVQTLLHPGIGTVEADAAQIEQVLLNLAVNARDAMPDGGRLAIETAGVVLDDAYASVHLGVEPGAYVMLSVSDTGCGMNAETLRMVFEPFFTTKDPGKGTGLGLATVYGIVKQHRGHVSVYSEVGLGTTFKIYLPRAIEVGQDGVAPSAPAGVIRGTETILVVEDDTAVRQLTHGALTRLGYDVIEAESGRDAIRLAAERETIHLLLTDVIMPEMSGREVCEQVAALHPGIKVLYMSGYTANVIAHHGVLDEGIHLLRKPFTRESLAQKIREVLAI
jgi:PAS domain S-box-containing protein